MFYLSSERVGEIKSDDIFRAPAWNGWGEHMWTWVLTETSNIDISKTGESLPHLYTTRAWDEAAQNTLVKSPLGMSFITNWNILEFEGIFEVINLTTTLILYLNHLHNILNYPLDHQLHLYTL